jgi:SAM-dependent methyltransferase
LPLTSEHRPPCSFGSAAIPPNSAEIAYWSGETGARWATFNEQLDRTFAPLSGAGLRCANVGPGQALLDIGSGCGATLLDLAEAVGPAGTVTGVDVSPPMLALAEQRARSRGLGNVRCILADAATHPFDAAAFDVVFSRFGVMFFDDPAGALANVRRSLRPDGRLIFVCWRGLAVNPWFSVPADAVRPYLAPQPPPDPDAPGPLAFADPNRVCRILEGADFADVRFDEFDARLRLGDRRSATQLLTHIGPAARLLALADDGARAEAERALEHALTAHESNGEVWLGAGVWIVSARPKRGAAIALDDGADAD